jgi:hypothetical protein
MPVGQDGFHSPQLFPLPFYLVTHQPSHFTNKNCFTTVFDYPLLLPKFDTTIFVYILKISHLWQESQNFQLGCLFRFFFMTVVLIFVSKQICTQSFYITLWGYFLFFYLLLSSCAITWAILFPHYASTFPMGSLAISQWEHPILARPEIQCCALSQQSTQEHWGCGTHGEPGYSTSRFPGLDQNLLDPFCVKLMFLFIVLCID